MTGEGLLEVLIVDLLRHLLGLLRLIEAGSLWWRSRSRLRRKRLASVGLLEVLLIEALMLLRLRVNRSENRMHDRRSSSHFFLQL